MDKFTKFTRFILCTLDDDLLTALLIALLFFDNIGRTFGLPLVVLHDRDVRFTANFWRELWRPYGVRVALTSSYYPLTDGLTERLHRTVELFLRCMLAKHLLPLDLWCTLLTSVELAINSAVLDSVGYNPMYMVFGLLLVTPMDIMVATESTIPAAADVDALVALTV